MITKKEEYIFNVGYVTIYSINIFGKDILKFGNKLCTKANNYYLYYHRKIYIKVFSLPFTLSTPHLIKKRVPKPLDEDVANYINKIKLKGWQPPTLPKLEMYDK